MTKQSHIVQLIKNLCPNGVKYMPLGEVCRSIFAGGTPSTRHAEYYNGDIPWLRSGEIDFNVITSTEKTITKLGFEKSSAKVVPAKSVVMAMTGATVAKVATTEIDLTANQSVCAIIPSSKLHYRYLYYYLSLNYEMLRATAQGAMSSFNLGIIRAISIPLPPLPIQEEIVRILDAFANLIENIDTEIKERLHELDICRNELLCNLKCGFKPLSEIFVMRGGYTPSTKNPEFWTEEGGFPWYTMDDIRKNGRKLTKSIRQITAKAIKSKGMFPAGTIVFATSATIGEHAMLMCPALTNQRFTALIPKLDNVFMPFYYHYGFIIDEWCLQHIKRGGFCSVDMEAFAKLSIPLPPLAEQRAIAEKLDTIEALIANLKTEHDLRQQQYEYYREYLINLLK